MLNETYNLEYITSLDNERKQQITGNKLGTIDLYKQI